MRNVLTYSSHRCMKYGQAVGIGLGALLERFGKDLAPCFITYNAATGAFHKAKQWVKALELLSEMWQKGLESNVIFYGTAVSACEKA